MLSTPPFDRLKQLCYDVCIIANIANLRVTMPTKVIASTEAQNNFGRILDDAVQNDVRYVIRRRNVSQAILLSLSDLERLLSGSDGDRQGIRRIIKDLSPSYDLGHTLDEGRE